MEECVFELGCAFPAASVRWPVTKLPWDGEGQPTGRMGFEHLTLLERVLTKGHALGRRRQRLVHPACADALTVMSTLYGGDKGSTEGGDMGSAEGTVGIPMEGLPPLARSSLVKF